jgi:hypothetical protein
MEGCAVGDISNICTVAVRFTSLEDVRRVVFLGLAGDGGRKLTEAERARLASRIAASLRDAGLLGSSIEQHYSAGQVAALCGGRTSAWAVKRARLGDFGRVFCDGGHWLIPASGVQEYLSRHEVAPVCARVEEIAA